VNSFSNKWSGATGEPTTHNPPSRKNLRDIRQLQIWAEGTKGPFKLEIKSIGASNAASELREDDASRGFCCKAIGLNAVHKCVGVGNGKGCLSPVVPSFGKCEHKCVGGN